MMIGGLNRSSSSLAIIAAAGLFAGGALMTPAQAADLGGDCCADLEERVAELEATAVRHGNRKVKLTLSGQVNTGVMYWDDGFEQDTYVYDSDEASSRIRLDAVGTISPGITAGMVIEFDIEVAGGAAISQANNDGAVTPGSGGFRFQARRFNWYVKGSMGKISVGQGSTAADGTFEVSFSNAWLGSVGYGLATTNINSFRVRNAAGVDLGTSWGNIGTDMDRFRENRVRYDSPTFAGFTLSGSWAEDDAYDVAVRYANEFGGLKLAAAASYHEADGNEGPSETYGGSLALQFGNFHIQGGYSEGEYFSTVEEREHYWIAAGVQFRASSLGMSDVTIQYINNELTAFGGTIGDTAEYEVYGIGLGQNIDAIGGAVYLSYNHHEADLLQAGVANSADFDQIQFGMRFRY